MWNTSLFLVLVTFSLITLLIGIPRQVRAIGRLRELPTGAVQATTVFGILQNLIFAIVAASLGILYGRQANLHAPVFESIAGGPSPIRSIQTQLIPSIVIGILSGFIFVALYFGTFRPRMDKDTAVLTERIRLEMGLPARILIGGIHEEIVFRWGVMGFFAWLGLKIFGDTTPLGMWISIILAGLIFGLAHLPGTVTLGIEPSRVLVISSLSLNLLAGTVYGWLFWQYGLMAAMIAHALYHVILFPFERHFIDQ